MIRSKKSMADTQFHWLFVILAGGFIFFFFAIFINQGIVANQNKQTALMLQYFDGVLSSSQNVQNLDDPIESTSSITIEQKCERGGQSRLTFVGQDLDKVTTLLPIFSHHKISGVTYALKTLPYDAPFRVDNPIYLTDTQTLYVVLGTQEIQDKYRALLPLNANVVGKEFTDVGSITESGFRDVVVITENSGTFATAGLAAFGFSSELIKSNLRWVDVQVLEKKVYYSYKDVTNAGTFFTSPASPDDSVSYDGNNALLLGAIMSEDADLFLCNKDKLDVRARVIAMQMYAHAGQLKSIPGINVNCVPSYDRARTAIGTFLSGSDLVQSELISVNGQLVRWSCPTLY